jgi:hypothetical protein
MKRGSGIKGRDDKSSGIEIRIRRVSNFFSTEKKGKKKKSVDQNVASDQACDRQACGCWGNRK